MYSNFQLCLQKMTCQDPLTEALNASDQLPYNPALLYKHSKFLGHVMIRLVSLSFIKRGDYSINIFPHDD